MLNTANQGMLDTTSVGNTYRGFLSNWFNAGNIAEEDWKRAEQAQNNQLVRDMYFQEKANQFNAKEAQKQRDYDREMSSTQYQRAVADLKAAGLNPVLAVSHGASFSGGTSASSSGARSSSSNNAYAGGDTTGSSVAGMLLSIAAGLITKGAVKPTHFGFGK